VTHVNSILDPADVVANLTKMEYFTALAMQGLVAHGCSSGYGDPYMSRTVAKMAVMIADAVIDELNKEGREDGTNTI